MSVSSGFQNNPDDEEVALHFVRSESHPERRHSQDGWIRRSFSRSRSMSRAERRRSRSGVDESYTPEQRANVVANAIESPLQDRERFVNAEELFSISQPPDAAEVEEGFNHNPGNEEVALHFVRSESHPERRHSQDGWIRRSFSRSHSMSRAERRRSRSGVDESYTPEQKANVVANAIESPLQDRERFVNAEELFSISQPPDAAEVEEGFNNNPANEVALHFVRSESHPERRQSQDRWNRRSFSRSRSMSRVERRRSMSRDDESYTPEQKANVVANAIESPLQERERFLDAESLFSISQPPDEAEVEEGAVSTPTQKEAPKVYPPFAYPVITSLIPGSIFGVLARLGLLALTNYDERATFPLAWVQGAGCLVMGFALGLREQIGAYYGPLYTAITAGFCGSLTTFSSWQFDIFLSWANTGHAHRDWFRDVIDGLSKTIFTLAISLASVTLGLHLSRPITRRIPRVRQAPISLRYFFRAACVLMYAATIPVYFKLSPSFKHQATAAMLFSFPGTLTRYILSATLTPLLGLFPLGTFMANTVGTALLGIFHVLQRTPSLPSPNACAILQGLMDGYCGCLTTVSTFAVEVHALRRKKAWLYVFLSWSVSQLLLLVILGSAWWGGNIDDNRMCTFA